MKFGRVEFRKSGIENVFTSGATAINAMAKWIAQVNLVHQKGLKHTSHKGFNCSNSVC